MKWIARLRHSSIKRPERLTPEEELWHELRDWFVDEGVHAGPDVMFEGLGAAGVRRLWVELTSRAEPIHDDFEIWHDELEREVRLSDLPDPVSAVQDGAIGQLLVRLHDIDADGVQLPILGLFVYVGSIHLYWWLDDNKSWSPATAAGLARLIGDLRMLEPEARIDFEYGDGEHFLGAIDKYLATRDLKP